MTDHDCPSIGEAVQICQEMRSIFAKQLIEGAPAKNFPMLKSSVPETGRTPQGVVIDALFLHWWMSLSAREWRPGEWPPQLKRKGQEVHGYDSRRDDGKLSRTSRCVR